MQLLLRLNYVVAEVHGANIYDLQKGTLKEAFNLYYRVPIAFELTLEKPYATHVHCVALENSK